MMNRDGFVAWLERELDQRNWRQADLVRASGITSAHVSRVMTGGFRPGLDFFEGVQRALKVPMLEILERAEIVRIPGDILPEVRTLNDRLLSLSDQERAGVLASIDSALRLLELHRSAERRGRAGGR
jgi:transcriptional regulator with XRE-family HTH domain